MDKQKIQLITRKVLITKASYSPTEASNYPRKANHSPNIPPIFPIEPSPFAGRNMLVCEPIASSRRIGCCGRLVHAHA